MQKFKLLVRGGKRERERERERDRVNLDTFYGILDFRSCLIISLLYLLYDYLFIYLF